ncbi:hypothetical protein [Sinosporangium siamense]|uniref:Uncharacterized protein n=1 Tax=Sinosporangium siamense TaxID=1367973 RepID=A0A919RMS7_9ACTN|nr:hypothetical protein [Sinosporangium siamense]GII95720.1 hypothetical protein Ssi02_59510 [Sinosporangium siamense]
MHGLYYRRGAQGIREGVACWNGHLLWQWEEVECSLPVFDSSLLSPWNLVLAERLAMTTAATPYGGDGDAWANAWKAQALLAGWVPFASFSLDGPDALSWCERAGAAGLIYTFEREEYIEGGRIRNDRLHIIAGRAQTYGELFDIPAVIDRYRAALPAGLAEQQIAPLKQHRDVPVATYVSAKERLLERAPRAVQGLTLGHPLEMTIMHVVDSVPIIAALRPADDPKDMPVLPPEAMWRPPISRVQRTALPRCRHPDEHERIGAAGNLVLGGELLAFVQAHWPAELLPSMVRSVAELATRGYVLATAYTHYLITPIPARRLISPELHQYICCVLRGLGRSPESIHLDAEVNRAFLQSV